MIIFQGQCKVNGVGMNNGSCVHLCKRIDSEIRLDIVFDVFLLAQNDCKCMPTRKSLFYLLASIKIEINTIICQTWQLHVCEVRLTIYSPKVTLLLISNHIPSGDG